MLCSGCRVGKAILVLCVLLLDAPAAAFLNPAAPAAAAASGGRGYGQRRALAGRRTNGAARGPGSRAQAGVTAPSALQLNLLDPSTIGVPQLDLSDAGGGLVGALKDTMFLELGPVFGAVSKLSGVVDMLPEGSNKKAIVGALVVMGSLFAYKYLEIYLGMRWTWPNEAEMVKENMLEAGDVGEDVMYGEMVQAVYDLFVTDPTNKNYGSCILGNGKLDDDDKAIRDLLKKFIQSNVKSLPEDFVVVKVLYSTASQFFAGVDDPDPAKSTFAGFVGYSESTKDLSIIFRGTLTPVEWQEDAKVGMVLWHKRKEREQKWVSWMRWLFLMPLLPTKTEHKGKECYNIGIHRGFWGLYSRDGDDDEFSIMGEDSESSWTGDIGSLLAEVSEGVPGLKKVAQPAQNKKVVESVELDTSLMASVRGVLKEYLEVDGRKDNKGVGKVDTITVSGHSLGSALATVAALDVVLQVNKHKEYQAASEDGSKKEVKEWAKASDGGLVKVRGRVFCSPTAGSKSLGTAFSDLNVDFRHYYERGDIVPTPLNLVAPSYRHVGDAFRLDPVPVFWPGFSVSVKSLLGPFCAFLGPLGKKVAGKDRADDGYVLHTDLLYKFWTPWVMHPDAWKGDMEFAGNYHNLEVMLTNVAYTAGLERDAGLINKGADMLHEHERKVPAKWWSPMLHNGVKFDEGEGLRTTLARSLDEVRLPVDK